MGKTSENVLEILWTLHYELGIYNENYIDYKCYKIYCDRIAAGGDEEAKEIWYQLNLPLMQKNRSIAYPFRYSDDVIAWKEEQIVNGIYKCAVCGFEHNEKDGAKYEATIDHIPALSERFNDEEWKWSREERRESYNRISQMRIVCKSKNSSLGGVKYNDMLIDEVYCRDFL